MGHSPLVYACGWRIAASTARSSGFSTPRRVRAVAVPPRTSRWTASLPRAHRPMDAMIDYFGEMNELVQKTRARFPGSVYCEVASSSLCTAMRWLTRTLSTPKSFTGNLTSARIMAGSIGTCGQSVLSNEHTDLHRALFFELEYAVRYVYKWHLTNRISSRFKNQISR